MLERRRKPGQSGDGPSSPGADGTRQLDDWLRYQGLESEDNFKEKNDPQLTYGDFDPNRVWHLALVQNNITRMSNWSSSMKRLSLMTFVAVITFLAHRGFPEENAVVLVILAVSGALLAVVAIWLLDAYYLKQERMFRKLYGQICKFDPDIKPFSMNAPQMLPSGWLARRFGRLSWLSAIRSRTLLLLHGAIATFVFGVLAYLVYATDIVQRVGEMF